MSARIKYDECRAQAGRGGPCGVGIAFGPVLVDGTAQSRATGTKRVGRTWRVAEHGQEIADGRRSPCFRRMRPPSGQAVVRFRAHHGNSEDGLPLQRQMPGGIYAKLRTLHESGFQAMAWTSGTRHWTVSELRGLKGAQVQMTRRIVRWWPRLGKDWPTFSHGVVVSRHGTLESRMRFRVWTPPFPRGGGIGQDLWGTKAQALMLPRAPVARRMEATRSAWPTQARIAEPIVFTMVTQTELPWQDFTLDRAAWRWLGQAFVARVPRRQPPRSCLQVET